MRRGRTWSLGGPEVVGSWSATMTLFSTLASSAISSGGDCSNSTFSEGSMGSETDVFGEGGGIDIIRFQTWDQR